MHMQAYEYVRHVAATLPLPREYRALELGSYDVNGSVRDLFPGASWYGIDLRPGPNVDLVCDACAFDGGMAYDLCVSTETMEHCPTPELIVQAAHRSLRPGGVFVATMAASGRGEHGVDGGAVAEGEYYGNITPAALGEMFEHGWRVLDLTHAEDVCDLYVTAVRR